MAINHLLTDKRIQKQALAQGLLQRHELEAHLASLPDLQDQLAPAEEHSSAETSDRDD